MVQLTSHLVGGSLRSDAVRTYRSSSSTAHLLISLCWWAGVGGVACVLVGGCRGRGMCVLVRGCRGVACVLVCGCRGRGMCVGGWV